MNTPSIILLAVTVIAVVVAFIVAIRKKLFFSCPGDCRNCIKSKDGSCHIEKRGD